jgi:hypothetical protein
MNTGIWELYVYILKIILFIALSVLGDRSYLIVLKYFALVFKRLWRNYLRIS